MSGPGVLHLWILFHRRNVVCRVFRLFGEVAIFSPDMCGRKRGGQACALPAGAAAFHPPEPRLQRRSETAESPGPPGSGALASGGRRGLYPSLCADRRARHFVCKHTNCVAVDNGEREGVGRQGCSTAGQGGPGPGRGGRSSGTTASVSPEHGPVGFAGPLQTWKPLSLLLLRKRQEGALQRGQTPTPARLMGSEALHGRDL